MSEEEKLTLIELEGITIEVDLTNYSEKLQPKIVDEIKSKGKEIKDSLDKGEWVRVIVDGMENDDSIIVSFEYKHFKLKYPYRAIIRRVGWEIDYK